MITCELYEEIDHYAWQEYVSTHPSSGIYHHIGWKSVIEDAYGHTALYLIAKNNNEVIGILPLILIKSRIFGSSLTSLPYLDHSGIIADDTSIQHLLIEKAHKLGQKYAVDHLELRQLKISEGNFSNYSEKVLMIMELEANEEDLLKRLSSERRNRIKRAKKSGLSVEITDSSKLHIFYEIWTNNMRDLGSPPHSLLFFKNILHNFNEQCTILLVKTDGVYIGAALALHWKDTITIPWVSSLRKYFKVYPNNILYWEAMRFAISQNIKFFDFGRSTHGSGTYEFKKRWGAIARPLHWQYLAVGNNKSLPIKNENKYKFAVEIWKKLPVQITRVVGPSLRKNITA